MLFLMFLNGESPGIFIHFALSRGMEYGVAVCSVYEEKELMVTMSFLIVCCYL